MSMSKLSMLKRFKDEKELREKVLVPLFERMDYETLLNHGVNEFGKDLVLIKNDDINIRRYTGVVVKKGNVNASSKKDSALLTDVSRQIKEAYEIKYNDLGSKKEIHIDKAFFICDGNISDQAKKVIVGGWGVSRELFEKNTDFITGETLVSLINKYWPFFFSSYAPEFNEYAEKLVAKLEHDDKARSVNINSNICDISHKYLHCNFYELVTVKNGKLKYEYRNVDSVFESKKYILILGQSGTGKSHVLREQIKKSLLRESMMEDSHRFKVYIRLSELAEVVDIDDNINKFIIDKIKCIMPSLTDAYISTFITDKNIDFYLDGFDEIGTEDKRNTTIKNIDSIIRNFNTSQVIVTTRELNIHVKQGLSHLFTRYDLKQLSYQESIDYIQSVVKETCKNSDEIMKEIKQQGVMMSLPRTPLTLQLITSLFSDNATKEVPSNITEVFKMYTEIMLGRWDKQRDVTNQFDYEQKLTLLSDIAYFMQSNIMECLSYSECIGIIEKLFTDMGSDPNNAKLLLNEIVHRSELLLYDEIDDCIRFKHRSFQEFFTANKVQTESLDFKIIAKHIANPWWDNTIIFLCGFRKKANDIIDFVIDCTFNEGIDDVIFKFRRGTNLGFMVRAGYQSSHKKEAIKKSLEDYDYCYNSGELTKQLKYISGNSVSNFALHMTLQFIFTNSYYSKLTKQAILDVVDELESDTQSALLNHIIAQYEDRDKLMLLTDKIRAIKDTDIIKACYYINEEKHRDGQIKLLESKVLRKLKKSAGVALGKTFDQII